MQQRLMKTMKRVAAVGTGVAMLGATLTGAMALDLGEYPAPFVTSGDYDESNVLVVGNIAAASDTLGMVDIATNLQFESKDCTASGGTIQVSGGVSEDIPLGMGIADPTSITLDQEIEDDDVDTLFDGSITFQSSDYDTREVLVLRQSQAELNVSTSLTSAEDDYQTDVVLEAARDSMKYYYAFDEAITVNASTASQPLEVKFLGKTIKVTSIGAANKFTAYVGTEYFMDVGDAIEVEGKTVTLVNVGDGGAIVIDVDGVIETISSTAETVNGVEIKVDETFYETVKSQRSASLIVGKDAQETYTDGDAYVGEDKDDPNWVWNIGNLNGAIATTSSTTGEFTGPYIGIENDFVWNDDSDNPAAVGDCIDLPNNYISICLNSLTVSDSGYKTFTFEFDTDADLSEADGATTTADAIFIHTNQNEGFVLDYDAFATQNYTSDQKSDKLWIANCLDGGTDRWGVYFEDTNSKTQLLGCNPDGTGTTRFANINYGNTKGSDLGLYLYNDTNTNGDINISLKAYEATNLPEAEWIDTMWRTGAAATFGVTRLGTSLSSEEAGEVTWRRAANFISMGTKDEDHRTTYGLIVRDPKSNGAGDQVVIDVPEDQVQANIVVQGTSTSTSSTGGEVCTVADITPVTKLDSEIMGSEESYNLIVVGGPCANKAVEAVSGFGVTCDGWDLAEGEGIIKLAANGEKVAMLIAGTEALDTRRAAKVVANWGDYAANLKGTEVLVKGTSLTDINFA